MPQINSFLMFGVLALVAMFQTADNLADAYGLAVTGTMLVTTILAYIVARRMWKWRLAGVLLLIAPMVCLDTVFLVANGMKIPSGGWVPLLIEQHAVPPDVDLGAGLADPHRQDPAGGRASGRPDRDAARPPAPTGCPARPSS